MASNSKNPKKVSGVDLEIYVVPKLGLVRMKTVAGS